MIYHVLLINAKMGILSPEIFIIPAIEETQILQRAVFHGFLYRFNFLPPWRDPWPSRVRQFALYLFPISIRRSTTWILCVLDVGLAGRVCFISTIPHLPPSTLIKLTHPILIAFLSGVLGLQSQAYPESLLNLPTTFLISAIQRLPLTELSFRKQVMYFMICYFWREASYVLYASPLK